MKVDNYNLENNIGEDIFWKVYLTTKNDDQKKYVTKVYERENIDKNSDLKNYLENEIRMLKYLNHPNIIKLHDIKNQKKIILRYMNIAMVGIFQRLLKIILKNMEILFLKK